MKKSWVIAVCMAAVILLSGCQDKSSDEKPSVPKIKFSETSSSKYESVSSEPLETNNSDLDKTQELFKDIPLTDSFVLNYKYSADLGGMVITDYYKESPKVRLPSELEGEPVVSVDFSDLDKEITMLVLPDGVKSVSLSPIVQKSLSYIYIPTTVRRLEDSDFSDCSERLTNIIYGDKVYDYNTIYHLIDSLDGLFDASGLKIVDNHLYDVARYLTKVSVPYGVNFIDGFAFSGCSILAEVNLPNDIGLIGEYAFDDCSSLESIELPNSVMMISDYAFRNCTNLKEIKVPESVEYIGEYAFSNCPNLTNVYLPNSLKHLSKNAFDKSPNVKIVRYGEIKTTE